MASTATTPPSMSESSSTTPQSTVDNKILKDLDVVLKNIDLCDSMLRPGGGEPAPSVQKDETLLSVIGFIEACAPRMVELVEAAAQGALSEHVLMKCLEVNDRLTKTLQDIDTMALTETPASTTVAAKPPPEDPFADFLDEDYNQKPPAAEVTGAPPSIGKTKSEDEFDSFFNERQSNA